MDENFKAQIAIDFRKETRVKEEKEHSLESKEDKEHSQENDI